jgi:hypothetical protein
MVCVSGDLQLGGPANKKRAAKQRGICLCHAELLQQPAHLPMP